MARISLVLSITALAVVLLGATPLGEAALEQVLPRGSVGTEQLKDGAVTAAKVKDRSLVVRDFRQGQLPRGPVGPQGPPGTIEGVPASGDLAGTYPAPALAPDTIESAEVKDGSLASRRHGSPQRTGPRGRAVRSRPTRASRRARPCRR